MKKEKTYENLFYETITKLVGKYSKWDIWKDFVRLSAISLANSIRGDKWEERENEYLSIVKKYGKTELDSIAQLLALTVLAIKENPEQDFLGSVYHRLSLQQEQKGQFLPLMTSDVL